MATHAQGNGLDAVRDARARSLALAARHGASDVRVFGPTARGDGALAPLLATRTEGSRDGD